MNTWFDLVFCSFNGIPIKTIIAFYTDMTRPDWSCDQAQKKPIPWVRVGFLGQAKQDDIMPISW